MAGAYTSRISSAPTMPASALEEELMDFENAATHFNTDEWALSELDEEALQGIVSGKPNTGKTLCPPLSFLARRKKSQRCL